ncbi:hypothetical protein PVL30_002539 [Lodderomyces elongisporus]|uniref:uncharacterized protein n=1 Tax=Lodderomyces elongisporus TaxID=36914 RepID=UPI002926E469|nr:uncharacterized protein PVL30_002535 [Lodderomyces elongisporus]XP_060975367.1 uncharacterized protein PVL30_002538 [Lodderomyces elongisporus]XP_060975368.1 uncharacterized protein PVL30_002539 [Lodderomyces elongisporus]WLF78791.1 hypothetical protein PVL30_002535 [Lodderomyces elongisporus]WLF78794.1 hypothetical protein PVL30_002538 [Lodderomyces elongisporus]WLF78795.1 hypothetical protein PVL30_002539 [Lodderomyces elongisporus]
MPFFNKCFQNVFAKDSEPAKPKVRFLLPGESSGSPILEPSSVYRDSRYLRKAGTETYGEIFQNKSDYTEPSTGIPLIRRRALEAENAKQPPKNSPPHFSPPKSIFVRIAEDPRVFPDDFMDMSDGTEVSVASESVVLQNAESSLIYDKLRGPVNIGIDFSSESRQTRREDIITESDTVTISRSASQVEEASNNSFTSPYDSPSQLQFHVANETTDGNADVPCTSALSEFESSSVYDDEIIPREAPYHVAIKTTDGNADVPCTSALSEFESSSVYDDEIIPREAPYHVAIKTTDGNADVPCTSALSEFESSSVYDDEIIPREAPYHVAIKTTDGNADVPCTSALSEFESSSVYDDEIIPREAPYHVAIKTTDGNADVPCTSALSEFESSSVYDDEIIPREAPYHVAIETTDGNTDVPYTSFIPELESSSPYDVPSAFPFHVAIETIDGNADIPYTSVLSVSAPLSDAVSSVERTNWNNQNSEDCDFKNINFFHFDKFKTPVDSYCGELCQ